METVIIKTAQLILALSLLIILHEGGHFIAAKLFKTRVEKFYLFFDYKFAFFSTYAPWFRKLMGKKPVPRRKNADGTETSDYEYEGTEYGIGWIPLGGYVKISGMIDESMDKEQMALPPKPWEFRTKPAWQRLIIMLAGIIVNFLTAWFIYSMILFTWGDQYVKSEDMTYGMKFSETAKHDGFCDGDIITYIDGKHVECWTPGCMQDISNAENVTVLRNGEKVNIELPGNLNLIDMIQNDPRYAEILIPSCVDSVIPNTPAASIGLKKGDRITSMNDISIADHNEFMYQIRVLKDVLTDESSHADSLQARTVTLVINDADTVSAVMTADFTLGFVPKMPYTDNISTREYGFFECIPAGAKKGYKMLTNYVDQMKYLFTKQGAKNVGGFIAIGNMFPNIWDWQIFWTMTAFLSLALGFMNLLPIPALDGGHALITIIEMATGRTPSDKVMERIQYAGMIFIIGLMILAQSNDILRLLHII